MYTANVDQDLCFTINFRAFYEQGVLVVVRNPYILVISPKPAKKDPTYIPNELNNTTPSDVPSSVSVFSSELHHLVEVDRVCFIHAITRSAFFSYTPFSIIGFEDVVGLESEIVTEGFIPLDYKYPKEIWCILCKLGRFHPTSTIMQPVCDLSRVT